MQSDGKGVVEELLKRLPGVSVLLDGPEIRPLVDRFGAALVIDLLRETLDGIRRDVLSGELDEAVLERRARPGKIAEAVLAVAEELLRPRPRRVINATGVVVHTNLGRSPLCAAAASRIAEAGAGYLDLEYEVERGERGSRSSHLEPLMRRLFPGHGFAVVNNNAAATLLALRALSAGRKVLISLGELVEIGGSFRVPDILEVSGAELCEVGTTNRTRLADYREALDERTGMILKVHTSNFRVVGFAEETAVAELGSLARESGVPLVVDWGSGNLVDLAPLGILDEQPVGRILDDGAHVVTFSGDKLLGGPQAGFVVGDEALVSRIRKDPLARVLRLDRLQILALHATLSAYVTGRAMEDVPTLRMLASTAEELDGRARGVAASVASSVGTGDRIEIVDGVSRTGGGSSPVGERPTRLLSVSCPTGDAGRLESRLRLGQPPVVGRVQDGKLLLDLRTVEPESDDLLAERLADALREEIERAG